MVQKVKDRIINALIMIVTGTIISVFSVAYAFYKDEDKETIQDIESLEECKLDKKDYLTDQKLRWANHDDIHDINDARDKETYEMVLWIYKNELSKQNAGR